MLTPSSAMRAIASLAAPGNIDALLAADALDLGIDLMSGRPKVYAYGTPTLNGTEGVTRLYDPINLTFTNPKPVQWFQNLQTTQAVLEDINIIQERYK